jgi:hypothetical protein
MNPKDREALDKFVDEDSLSPEDTKRFAEMSDGERATFIAGRFFEAGAKHGRSQLNELRDDNMAQLYETIKKLQEENKNLRDALVKIQQLARMQPELFEVIIFDEAKRALKEQIPVMITELESIRREINGNARDEFYKDTKAEDWEL